MKTTLMFAASAAFLFACSSAPEETVEAKDAVEVEKVEEVVETKSIDVNADQTTVHWVGFKTYSDGRHEGTIAVKGGQLMVEGDQLIGGEFTIDMTNIQVADLADNEEKHGQLVGHLMSDDFFAAETHPEAKFTITGVEESADAEKGTSHIISGNLMMRGTEKNISFPASVTMADGNVKVNVPEFAIDRKNWNVMYGSTGIEGLAKDKLIDDNILLEIQLNS